MYAIIQRGGHQYRVEQGQVLNVERLDAEQGTQLSLGDVVFLGGEVPRIGRPFVDGASVQATVIGPAKGPKLMVFKYRRKNRYRVKTGHRQKYTRVRVDSIQV
jgi:large subunit ribosomal protein L21